MVGQDARGDTPQAADAGLWAEGLDLSLIVLADTSGEFWTAWNPDEVLPVTYVIDERGRVTWAERGDAGALPRLRAHVLSLVEP